MIEVKRFTPHEMITQPMLLEMIEWRCWNMLGVGRFDVVIEDNISGDLVFYQKEAASPDNGSAIMKT